MPQELALNWESELSLISLLFNVAVGIILSLAVSWHFKSFGSTLSNRQELARILPFITLTTILIIAVVKSSLALSLGLVGALSIVRFRTPIKEPEELAYLFLSIAIGLGLGANQTVPTVVVSLAILIFMGAYSYRQIGKAARNIFLTIDLHISAEEDNDHILDRLNEAILPHVNTSDLRRFDIRESSIEAAFIIDVDSIDVLTLITNNLRTAYPAIGVSFLDQNSLRNV